MPLIFLEITPGLGVTSGNLRCLSHRYPNLDLTYGLCCWRSEKDTSEV